MEYAKAVEKFLEALHTSFEKQASLLENATARLVTKIKKTEKVLDDVV